jgi:hypothetical protein
MLLVKPGDPRVGRGFLIGPTIRACKVASPSRLFGLNPTNRHLTIRVPERPIPPPLDRPMNPPHQSGTKFNVSTKCQMVAAIFEASNRW